MAQRTIFSHSLSDRYLIFAYEISLLVSIEQQVAEFGLSTAEFW
jgi:hypothetical protein